MWMTDGSLSVYGEYVNAAGREVLIKITDDKSSLVQVKRRNMVGYIDNRGIRHLPQNSTFYSSDIMVFNAPVTGQRNDSH